MDKKLKKLLDDFFTKTKNEHPGLFPETKLAKDGYFDLSSVKKDDQHYSENAAMAIYNLVKRSPDFMKSPFLNVTNMYHYLNLLDAKTWVPLITDDTTFQVAEILHDALDLMSQKENLDTLPFLLPASAVENFAATEKKLFKDRALEYIVSEKKALKHEINDLMLQTKQLELNCKSSADETLVKSSQAKLVEIKNHAARHKQKFQKYLAIVSRHCPAKNAGNDIQTDIEAANKQFSDTEAILKKFEADLQFQSPEQQLIRQEKLLDELERKKRKIASDIEYANALNSEEFLAVVTDVERFADISTKETRHHLQQEMLSAKSEAQPPESPTTLLSRASNYFSSPVKTSFAKRELFQKNVSTLLEQHQNKLTTELENAEKVKSKIQNDINEKNRHAAAVKAKADRETLIKFQTEKYLQARDKLESVLQDHLDQASFWDKLFGRTTSYVESLTALQYGIEITILQPTQKIKQPVADYNAACRFSTQAILHEKLKRNLLACLQQQTPWWKFWATRNVFDDNQNIITSLLNELSNANANKNHIKLLMDILIGKFSSTHTLLIQQMRNHFNLYKSEQTLEKNSTTTIAMRTNLPGDVSYSHAPVCEKHAVRTVELLPSCARQQAFEDIERSLTRGSVTHPN